VVPAAQGDLIAATRAAIARTLALSAIVGALGVPVVWLAIVLVRARWFADLGQPPRPFDPYLESLSACWLGPFVGVALGLVVGWLRLVVVAGRAGRDGRGGAQAMRAGADTTARAATTAIAGATAASPSAGVDAAACARAPDATPEPGPDPAPPIVWLAWGLCGVFAAVGLTVVTGPAVFVCLLGWLRVAD
jgi:hypothetical protein